MSANIANAYTGFEGGGKTPKTQTKRINDVHLQSPLREQTRKIFTSEVANPTDKNHWLTRTAAEYSRIYRDAQMRPFEVDIHYLVGTIFARSTDSRLMDLNDSHVKHFLKAINPSYFYSLKYETSKENSQRQIDLAVDLVETSYAGIYQGTGLNTRKIFNEIRPSGVTSYSTFNKECFSIIKSLMSSKRSNHDYSWQTIQGLVGAGEYRVCDNFTIAIFGGQQVVLTYDDILMITDNLEMRSCSYLACDIADSLIHKPLRPFPSSIQLCKFYSYFDSLMEILGNDVYNIISEHEGICMGQIIATTDPLRMAHDYLFINLRGAWDSLHEVLVHKQIVDPHNVKVITDIMEAYEMAIISERNLYILSEYYRMHRFWGHPTVDSIGGCLKVKKIIQEHLPLNLDTIRELTGLLKRIFVQSYILREAHWPDVYTAHPNEHMAKMLQKKDTQANLKDSRVTLKDWADVVFKKVLDLKIDEDYTVYYDDKSIAFPLDLVIHTYDTYVTGPKPTKEPTWNGRLLIDLMYRNRPCIEQIIQDVMERKVDPKEYVIVVCEKEREIKIMARLFAKLTHTMRTYFVVTEKALKDELFPYYPYQTMDMSEHQVMMRLLKVGVEEESDFLLIKINLDLKNWNLRFNSTTMDDLLGFFDELFGTPGLYTFTHEFFMDSHVFLGNQYELPSEFNKYSPGDTPESDTHWGRAPDQPLFDPNGRPRLQHGRGFEGQRQKGWTVFTLGLCLLAAERTRLKMYLTCQGDNQFPVILIPKLDPLLSHDNYCTQYQASIEDKVKQFLDEVEKICTDCGHILKRNESTVSSVISYYGKVLLVRGEYATGMLNKISRLFPEVNELYPTPRSEISTIGATCISSMMVGLTPLVALVLGYVEAQRSFIWAGVFTPLVAGPMSNDLITRMRSSEAEMTTMLKYELLLGSSLNGWSHATILDTLCRGHPDTLTKDIQFLIQVAKSTYPSRFSFQDAANHLLSALDDPTIRDFFSEDIHCSLLIQDPFSVNWSIPDRTNIIVKQAVTSVMRMPETMNEDIKSILTYLEDSEIEEVCNFLCQSRPFLLKGLSELFNLSPYGAALRFIGNYKNVRTLSILFENKGDEDVGFKIEAAATKHMDWTVKFINHARKMALSSPPDMCSTVLANKLRSTSWKEGHAPILSPIQGITTAHPLCQTQIRIFKGLCPMSEQKGEHCTETFWCKVLPSDRPRYSCRGGISGYYGSKTYETTHKGKVKVSRASSSAAEAFRIAVIMDWIIKPGSGLWRLCKDFINARSTIGSDDILRFSGESKSRCFEHRFSDMKTSAEALYTMMPNYPTHCYLCTDGCGELSRGEDNYNVFFQEIMVDSMSMCDLAERNGDIKCTDEITLHAHFRRDTYRCKCTTKIVETYIDNIGDSPEVATLFDNPIICSQSTVVEQAILDFLKSESIGHIKVPTEEAGLWSCALQISAPKRKADIVNQLDYADALNDKSNLSINMIAKMDLLELSIQVVKLVYLRLHQGIQLSSLIHDQSFFITLFINQAQKAWENITNAFQLDCCEDQLSALARYSENGITTPFEKGNKSITRPLVILALKFFCLGIQSDPSYLVVRDCIFTSDISVTKSLYLSYVSMGLYLSRKWSKLVEIASYGYFRDFINMHHEGTTDSLMHLLSLSFGVHVKEFVKSGEPIFKLYSHDPINIYKDLNKNKNGQNSLIRTFANITRRFKLKPFTTDLILNKRAFTSKTPNVVKILYSKDKTRIVSPFTPPRPYDKYLYSQSFRIVSYISTTLLKVLEIIGYQKPELEGGTYLALGDGECGLSSSLKSMYGMTVYPCSLQDLTKITPHRAHMMKPGGSLHDPEGWEKLSLQVLTGGDLTNEDCIRSILNVVPTEMTLMTVDADPPMSTEVGRKIFDSVIKISQTISIKYLIIKIFYEGEEILEGQLDRIGRLYGDVFVHRCIYSGQYNRELYIFATTRHHGILNCDLSASDWAEFLSKIDSSAPLAAIFSDHAYNILSFCLNNRIMNLEICNNLSKITNGFWVPTVSRDVHMKSLKKAYYRIMDDFYKYLRTRVQGGKRVDEEIYATHWDNIHTTSTNYFQALFHLQLIIESTEKRIILQPWNKAFIYKEIDWKRGMHLRKAEIYTEEKYRAHYQKSLLRAIGHFGIMINDGDGSISLSSAKYREFVGYRYPDSEKIGCNIEDWEMIMLEDDIEIRIVKGPLRLNK